MNPSVYSIKSLIFLIANTLPNASGQLRHWYNNKNSIKDEFITSIYMSSLQKVKDKIIMISCSDIISNNFASKTLSSKSTCVPYLIALNLLCEIIDSLYSKSPINSQSSLKALLNAVECAVDLDMKTNGYLDAIPSTHSKDIIKDLVLFCRQQLKNYPSYPAAKHYMCKYIKLYIDYQSTKYTISKDYWTTIRQWSLSAIEKLPELKSLEWWQLCIAADSPFLTSCCSCMAVNENISQSVMDDFINNHICKISFLNSCIQAMWDNGTSELNPRSKYYPDLKYLENNIVSFLCENEQHPYIKVIEYILAASFLISPYSSHGMNKIASRNILKQASFLLSLYTVVLKASRIKNYFAYPYCS